ncbi:MAG: (E)-4-hydroxy-3-methylbut-2-enyl-diphosphate synthase [Bacteroidales bacterium]|nr:(E)-4-hydroxy-3-methylbut-2-enyl-diphosphate synthase [Bacteroidales bacterium]MDD4209399.1 (E)-4-hydroxy-3-methylbut-2-enyl-diphosphate synthase [Bacteroidales bacterium]
MEQQNKNYILPDFYTDSPFDYKRRIAREVSIGHIPLGGINPIRIQSMVTVTTINTEACVAQIMSLANAGAEYVRLTTTNVADAQNLKNIKKQLSEKQCRVPLIADVHFQSKIAEIAAQYVEKVRINPGNYSDEKNKTSFYSDTAYDLAVEHIAERLHPLLRICKENGTALRIGTNHGSLSDRILSRYGNSPLGMVISAMEFAAICADFGFHELVFSMKASNTRVMIQSVRLLAAMLDEKGWNYPLHLGVTEAGDGEYGRIKSAAGIAPLLADGIGDTIRVSLTEPPENEIPFAQVLAQRTYLSFEINQTIHSPIYYNPFEYHKRRVVPTGKIKGKSPIIVSDSHKIKEEDVSVDDARNIFLVKDKDEVIPDMQDVLILEINEGSSLHVWRRYINELQANKQSQAIIFKFIYNEKDWMTFYAKVSGDVAFFATDGFVDGVWIINDNFSRDMLYQISLDVLQACGLRYSKAEYIACPSCGRTLYDIQDVLKKIKAKTSHLKNLKIGVMGCIVNGPGEMADADYGFVGSGKGKITLYKGKEAIHGNIKEEDAINSLIQLIKDNGDWIEQ